MSKRVAILISGGGSNMVSLVKAMQSDGFATPTIVIANDPNAGGLAKAESLGVPTRVVDHKTYGKDRCSFEKALQKALVDANVEIVCLAGFMRILSAEFVTPWAGKMLNIHPSILPKYKGLRTHARALEAGDKVHGCTVHGVTGALDDGPIYGQALIDVLKDDDPDTLARRLLPFEHLLFPEVLRRFVTGETEPVLIDGRPEK